MYILVHARHGTIITQLGGTRTNFSWVPPGMLITIEGKKTISGQKLRRLWWISNGVGLTQMLIPFSIGHILVW